MTVAAAPALRCRIYVPSRSWGRSPLVVVHGSGRAATRAFEAFLPAAIRTGTPLLAPRFPTPHFERYQQLAGAAGPLAAADALDAALAVARDEHGLSSDRVHLFGFSGGAQFAHRYALLRPQHVMRVTVAAAGWYTWLDPDVPFPRGLGPSPASGERTIDPRGFLELPVHVLVGAHDVEQDAGLRRRPALDRQQGPHRLARALRWVDHLESVSESLGLPVRASCTLLPDTGHSMSQAVQRGGLVDHVLPSGKEGDLA